MLRDTTRVRLKRIAKYNELQVKIDNDLCCFGADSEELERNIQLFKESYVESTISESVFRIKHIMFSVSTYSAEDAGIQNMAGIVCVKICINTDSVAESCIIISDAFESWTKKTWDIQTVFEVLDIDDTMFDYEADSKYIVQLIDELSIPDFVYLYLRAEIDKENA